ncbi:ArnT family glycosyltransferase [Myxacorys almedinensis]|uniref:4-amino-4-deoxy-L-arabinose transferase n=1 Tax=Myxacorys almedinensis A TaxID=2690445 RepID=A0A8J8CML1_9CYAN|nr:glycosyltransferase family 39 protein [Myxacorys almedinensis]NDJ18800.1 4-amino-4-deoxy-L-arabinose transferase [Myxacorys almedinensis A]
MNHDWSGRRSDLSKRLKTLLPFLPPPSSLLPYFTLLFWVLPLVLVRSPQQSLMAHDEGIYAMQARSLLLTGDWVTPQWGEGYSFDRTIGIQWLIAGCYWLFGTSEGTARLSSAISWILSVLLTYRIGCFLLNPRLAWLGAAIFSVIPLVVQYGRLATQDAVLVLIELVGIWALLEAGGNKRPFWYILAGSTFGVGFLIKGFMVIPAAIALLPYTIRHRHLLNPWLYGGLALGAIPPIGWMVAAVRQYGSLAPLEQLFGKLFHLGGQTYLGAGRFYYVWNIPANGFPWVFFAVGGVGLVLQNHRFRDLVKSNQAGLLLVGYPLILLAELTSFGTKTHYYPLQLMPFVGLLGAIALDHLVGLHHMAHPRRFITGLNLLIGGLAIIVLALVIGAQTPPLQNRWGNLAERGTLIGVIVGLGWLGTAISGLVRASQQWMAGLLLTSWLALATMNLTGLWGNYSPNLKTALQQPQVQAVLRSQPIDFVVEPDGLNRRDRKTYLLLNFYTPNIGAFSTQRQDAYAWIDPNLAKLPHPNDEIMATVEGWQLVERK